MIGDQTDGASRVRSLLPFGWFEAGASPVLDAVLQGYGWAISWAYALLAYVKLQTRIATASGAWLDLIAFDFFGRALLRKPGQTDAALRARILASLFQEKATRKGMVEAIATLTGNAPFIFEPTNASDTGGYGAGCAYGLAGGYGTLTRSWTAYMIVQLPAQAGVVGLTGYGAFNTGYGVGQAQYEALADLTSTLGDEDVFDAIDAVRPAGVTVWVNIGGSRFPAPAAPSAPGSLNFGDPTQSGLLGAAL
jgi:hypothetical protein